MIKYNFALVGLTLDEQCYVHGQCTGTTNSGVCMADQTDNGKLICQCAASYLRHKDNCLQGKVCKISKQFLSLQVKKFKNHIFRYMKKIVWLTEIIWKIIE